MSTVTTTTLLAGQAPEDVLRVIASVPVPTVVPVDLGNTERVDVPNAPVIYQTIISNVVKS